MKICTRCHEPKPLSAFAFTTVKGRHYRRSWCESCERAYRRDEWLPRNEGYDTYAARKARANS